MKTPEERLPGTGGRSSRRATTVSGRFDNPARLEFAIVDALEAWSLASDLLDSVLIATWEAVANAIVHGGSALPLVTLRLPADDDQLVVTVMDSGPGFDLESLLEAVNSQRPLVPGGKGIHLMWRCMDDVAFGFPSQGGTVVRLRKRVVRASKPDDPTTPTE